MSPLTSSCVNLMLLSMAFICFLKASTSPVLILTQVSSTYPNQWLRGSSCEGNHGSALKFLLWLLFSKSTDNYRLRLVKLSLILQKDSTDRQLGISLLFNVY